MLAPKPVIEHDSSYEVHKHCKVFARRQVLCAIQEFRPGCSYGNGQAVQLSERKLANFLK